MNMSTRTPSEITTRIKSILVDITGYDAALLTSDTPLTPDVNSDPALSVGSLEFAELLITLEEEFQLSIPDEVASTLKTVGNLITYVIQHMPPR